MSRPPILAAIALAVAALTAPPLHAQLGDLVKQKVKAKAQQSASKGIDEALNQGENAVKCVITDKACIKGAKNAGKTVVVTDAQGKPVSSADSAAAIAAATGAPGSTQTTAATGAPGNAPGTAVASAKPGEGAWANYDFVPGERVLFFEDFSKDTVGDFPRRLELKRGNLEVVDWQGGRYLRSAEGYADFYIPLPEVLPERFTVEFDYAGSSGIYTNTELWFDKEGAGRNYIQVSGRSAGVAGGSVQSTGNLEKNMVDKFYHARIMADGKHVKVYANEQRVANAPNANLGRSNKVLVKLAYSGTKMLTNIRVAAGGKKLYDALADTGRVSTQGIYFDTGSDRIRPESTPTLKEIGQMLQEHPELKLTIVGHTDNVGGAAFNQALSEKRAQAVREFLVSTYGIEPSRVAAKGMGATKPVASNDTPEGRQNNRRVELVKS
jgi:OmpA-OmpF porin, OOP family